MLSLTADLTPPPNADIVLPVVRVGLDVPIARAFDFLLPPSLRVSVGSLVVVPFGRQRIVGVVLETNVDTDIARDKLRAVESVKQDVLPLSPEILAVFAFCAEYYHAPIGQIALNAIPPMLRSANQPAPDLVKVLRITAAGREALPSIPSRAIAQRSILQLLAESTAALPEKLVRERHARAGTTIKRLLDAGWVESIVATNTTIDAAQMVPAPATVIFHAAPVLQAGAPSLNAEQAAAVLAIGDALQQTQQPQQPQQPQQLNGKYQAFLLDGITGSGKTEVYLAAIAATLEQGKQALVLVPEINLTPAFLRQIRTRFPSQRIAAAHSGMPNVARYQAWRQAQHGDANIVVGTRLAVFTPMPRLGLVIVDEEHDPSFKQQEGVRYSARDVAVFRASISKCPVVLGSATPSIESLDNVARGRFEHISLRTRAVPNAALPTISFIDLDAEKAPDGITQSMIRAIDETLKRGEQAMVFINRRGFAPALVCGNCGWMPECRRCSARMVFHRSANRLRCHHCGADAPPPQVCRDCASTDLHPAGQGSERIEAALADAFPDRRIARVDRDSTRRRGSAEAIFVAAEKGELDILVGTQMLTKGHDFPNVTLVGVINADGAVFSADFRAAERMAQQLMQVAGRAGRAHLAGRVLIQTRFVEHQVYQAVARHDYAAFVRAALAERQLMKLPPYSYLALLRAEARDAHKLDLFMARAQQLAAQCQTDSNVGLQIWDTVVATLERKAGYSRKQLMVQADGRRGLQQFLARWITQIREIDERTVRWNIDVDPIEV
jgi:primosomal protein N' (replication factor Y)